MSARWLITGGVGYIGAHVVRAMTTAGHKVVVLDDLSTGERRKVPANLDVVVGSVLDTAAVHAAVVDHQITGIMHIAAKKSVEESVRDPDLYHEQNVVGMESLLAAIGGTAVNRFVLSSSAARAWRPDGSVPMPLPARPSRLVRCRPPSHTAQPPPSHQRYGGPTR